MRGASILSDKFIRTARQAREKCGRTSERASVGFVTMSLFALFLPLGMASAAQYALWFNAAMCGQRPDAAAQVSQLMFFEQRPQLVVG